MRRCVQILKRKCMSDLNLEVTEIGACPRFLIRYTYDINLKLLHRSVFELLHSRVLSARLAVMVPVSLVDSLLGNMFVFVFALPPPSPPLSLFRHGDAHCGLPLLAHTPTLITTRVADPS